jgi:hypothetical protein
VKVRPSGQASFLQADGSYRVAAADSIMVTGRTVTETTTVGGRQSQKVVKHYAWYNPTAYDPNFDTAPPGTSYNGAYGDQTFHRDEAETFMLVSTETTAYFYDPNGTLLRQVDSIEGWYAPHRAGNYAADRVTLTNGNGGYVFPCSTTRIQPVETYQTTDRIEKTYIFDGTGTLTRISEKTYSWYAATAASDLYTDDATGLEVVPPTSPYQSPCPGGYGAGGGTGVGGVYTRPLKFQPSVVLASQAPGQGTFIVSATGIPTGIVSGAAYTAVQTLLPGSWVYDSATGQYNYVASGLAYELTEGPYNASWSPTGGLEQIVYAVGSVIPDIPVSPYAYAIITVTDNNGNDYFSERAYFDSRYGRFPSNYNLP